MFVAHKVQICLRVFKGPDMLSHGSQEKTAFFFLSVLCVKAGWIHLMMQNWWNTAEATMNSCQAKVQSIVGELTHLTSSDID